MADDIREKYQNWSLKQRAEYWGEILDNVRMGIYDEDTASNYIEAVQGFLLNEVAPNDQAN